MSETPSVLPTWGLLELMGHRQVAGYISETTLAGVSVLRVDVPGPDDEPAATQLYHPSALYALTPLSEAAARARAESYRPRPVGRYAVGCEDERCFGGCRPGLDHAVEMLAEELDPVLTNIAVEFGQQGGRDEDRGS